MVTIVNLLWLGGLIPAYRAARNNNLNIFSSVICAVIWPADVGWHLAKVYCQDHKE